MKNGDIVRFKSYTLRPVNNHDCGIWSWKLGLLVEYEKWEKVASILCEGEVLRIRAEDVQKSGKKDFERFKNI